MKINILITGHDGISKNFSSGTKAIRYLKNTVAKKILLNTEIATFKDIAELYQLELAEKRHWQNQNN